jgi:hypothetical protein
MHEKNQQLLKLADTFYQNCIESLEKVAKIRKLPNGKYRVLSEKNKNLGTSDSREKAEKRLKQVEYFKYLDDKSKAEDGDTKEKVIDLTGAIDFSYSAIMREMRQHASKDQVRIFLTLFKKEFDKGVKAKLQKPEKVALQNSLVKFNKQYKVKCKKKLVKNAAISELGNPTLVGKYLADIVRFTLNKVPLDQKQAALDSLRKKFYSFNAEEISQKSAPPTSAIGQSITFVKHFLFNHDAQYIREVLNSIAGNL